jgi:ParB family chromosome partitioning protein
VTTAPHGPVAVRFIPLADVHPNPRNPRRDYGDLTDLVASIKTDGVLQPCLAEPRAKGGVQLLAGHRRLRASRLAGRETLPVVLVGERLNESRLVTALTENIHREPLSPLDEAKACRELLGLGHSRQNIASILHRSAQWVTDRMTLLDLPDELQYKVSRGELTVTAATKLARTKTVVTGAKAPQHLHRGHPLAPKARELCDAAEHATRGRIGPACGRCWETAIRNDERGAA